ncbi:MAG: DUF2905 domain-containing protein [Anaerolineaceae bacterium]|nr:DUF2905 domain-containing protein [Anaerolineaceae bacterium]
MSPNLVTLGKWFVILGLCFVFLGGILWGLSKFFGWEKFPGTIRFQISNMTCIFPLLGSIILSIVLTLLLNLIIRLFNR